MEYPYSRPWDRGECVNGLLLVSLITCFVTTVYESIHPYPGLYLCFCQVMDVLLSLQVSQMESDDPTTSYMLQVCFDR